MNNILSDRLKLIASLVINGESVADIGTDHGYIPIHLLAENEVPFAILSDINEGPLSIAEDHIKSVGINPKYYDLRLGPGMSVLKKGEVSTVIIAGMGGEMISGILAEDFEKTHSIKRFILQPRTRANELRMFLSNAQLKFVDYRLVKEKNRICEVFVVEPTTEQLPKDIDIISKFLIEKKDPLIKEFVDYKIASTKTVLESIKRSSSDDGLVQDQFFKMILDDLNKIREEL